MVLDIVGGAPAVFSVLRGVDDGAANDGILVGVLRQDGRLLAWICSKELSNDLRLQATQSNLSSTQ
jgi:hypothetical protein